MVLVLVLVTAVVIALRAPAERDRLHKRAALLTDSDNFEKRLDASEMEEKATHFDLLARVAPWVAVLVAIALVVMMLSSLVTHHG